MISINFNGKSYRFSRFAGGGHWLLNNVIVCLSLHQQLSAAARKMGLTEEHNFALHTPKPEPRKPVSVGRSSGRPKVSKTAVKLKIRRRPRA